MEIVWIWMKFVFGLLFLHLCNGSPIDLQNTVADEHTQLLTGLVAVLLTICCIVLLAGCLCCQRRNRFKQFHDSAVAASTGFDIDHGHVNPIANGEFTIFTPLSPPHFNNNIFLASDQIITRSLDNHTYEGFDLSSWFNESEKDFPRIKLKYIKELGKGWFGKVVEGAAQDVEQDSKSWTPVVVRILDVTSSQNEKLMFLQDAALYRCGTHANILMLIGKCLDTVPFLLLQEYCPQGDLKKYLKSNRNNIENILSTEYPLLWCCQLTSALNYLHKNKVTHSDLAARNCLLSSNLTLKLGDYGLGIYNYPNDYYQSSPGVPVRWCAPESLNCTQTTIQPKKASPESNVWSLGVTMWEICECGEQPYSSLNDDEVISMVLGPPHIRLDRPSYSVLYTDYIFRLMQLCWTTNAESRATVLQIDLMLSDLLQVLRNTTNNVINDSLLSVNDFDRRWQSFKPNYIVKTDHMSDSIPVEINDSDFKTKTLSHSLNNLLLENGPPMECYIEDEFKCEPAKRNEVIVLDVSSSSDSEQEEYHKKINVKLKLDKQEKCITNPFSDDTSFFQRMSSGSETEDENWRNKVERGAYTEKVRMKSRSVADLMVLTTVDYSESESETPLPSLDYRVNYKNVRYAPANNLENVTLTFGSEGNLLSVEDTFQEELKKLKEERRDSMLFVPDNNSQIIFKNPESNLVNTSRLIGELNDTSEIKPANLVYNMFNVTIENYSPLHVKNELKNIIFSDDFAYCKTGQSMDVDMGCEKIQVLPIHEGHTYKNDSCDTNLNNISVLTYDIDNLRNDVRNDKNSGDISHFEFNISKDDIVHCVETKTYTQLEEKQLYEEVVHISCKLVDEVLDQANTFIKKNKKRRVPLDSSVLKKDHDGNIKYDVEIQTERYSYANLNENLSTIDRETTNTNFFEYKGIRSNNPPYEQFNMYSNGQIYHNNITQFGVTENNENKTSGKLYTSVGQQTDSIVTMEISKKKFLPGNLIHCEPHLLQNIEFRDLNPESRGKKISYQIEDKNFKEGNFQVLINDNQGSDELLSEQKITNDVETLNKQACSPLQIDTEKRDFVIDSTCKSESILPINSEPTFNKLVNNGTDNLLIDYKIEALDSRGSERYQNNEKTEIARASWIDDTNSDSNISTLNVGNPKNEQVTVIFDISSNQEEVKPNSLTHSNLFTSTPFRKKEMSLPLSLDNDYASINLFTETSENSKEFELHFLPLEDQNFENKQLHYSLETWDNFLDKTLDQSENLFDSFSEPQRLLSVSSDSDNKKGKTVIINKEEPFMVVVEDPDSTKTMPGSTFVVADEVRESEEVNKTFVKTNPEVLQYNLEVSNDSWESGGGWFLHPQTSSEYPIGEMEIQRSNTDSYVGFGIDEEIMSAIRNELIIKLPHAQGVSSERLKDEDEWECGERSEVFLKYNVYNTPLSPIPEESVIEESSGSNTPKQEIENIDSDWSDHCEAEVFLLDNESNSTRNRESPHQGHLYRDTPSQDSCCSNDTLFNLEELTSAPAELDLPIKNTDLLLPKINVRDNLCEENPNQTYSLEKDNSQTKVESSELIDAILLTDTDSSLVDNDIFLLKEKEYSSETLSETKHFMIDEEGKNDLLFPLTHAVPLPSPEDIPWRQLPASLLNYEKIIAQSSNTLSLANVSSPEYVDTLVLNENQIIQESDENEKKIAANILENNINDYGDYVNIVNKHNAKNMLEYDNLSKMNKYSNEEYIHSDNENVYGVLTDIRFNGPSDNHLMSTSFSESNNCDEQDWDSGSDSRSSSSGEFIWKEGEHEESLKALSAIPQDMVEDVKPMESIAEDLNEKSDISSTFSDDDDEIPEFVPSAWDQFAMPGKSALRSPEKILQNGEKKSKGVWFKKQKYHCIYEYPRESDSPPNDYKIFTDWEFDGEPYIPSVDDIKKTTNHIEERKNAKRDLYQLTTTTDFMPNDPGLEDEFFISSSTQPFEIPSSQFFPGHNNWIENVTPDSGIEDLTTPNSIHNHFSETIIYVPKLRQLAYNVINKKKQTSLNKDMMGGLRHAKNKLKLDLPPSPSAFTAEKLFMIESAPTLEPSIREKPTFTTFGKSRFLVQHVDTPPDESKCKNVSFEALPYKPILEDQRTQNITIENHNNMNNELYIVPLEKNIIKNDSTDTCKLNIEIVRGEASLLDSADEDSGIESSTLERKFSTANLS